MKTSVNTIGFNLLGKTGAFLVMVLAAFSVSACGGSKAPTAAERLQASEEIYQIGVNAYLWRATLETLSFMPMAQVDSKGGVIITEWVDNPKVPGERVKTTVYIVDGQLRADALKVNVFRQVQKDGQWQDVPARAGAEVKLTQAILDEARILHRNNAPKAK